MAELTSLFTVGDRVQLMMKNGATHSGKLLGIEHGFVVLDRLPDDLTGRSGPVGYALSEALEVVPLVDVSGGGVSVFTGEPVEEEAVRARA